LLDTRPNGTAELSASAKSLSPAAKHTALKFDTLLEELSAQLKSALKRSF